MKIPTSLRPVRPRHIVTASLSLTVALASTAACGVSVGAGTPSISSQSVVRADRNVISRQQLAEGTATNALEAVQRWHPQWLRRGHHTPVVYVDFAPRGGPSELALIPVVEIYEIGFLSSGQATTRFGTDHPGGVILVLTRNGAR